MSNTDFTVDNGETIRTRAINYTRENWKTVLTVASWALTLVITTSVAIGRKQMDNATLTSTVSNLVTDVKSMRSEMQTLSKSQAVMSTKLDSIHEDVRDFKDWKDRVTGVAETVNVPKLGRRARKP